jgi:hypothetical protein
MIGLGATLVLISLTLAVIFSKLTPVGHDASTRMSAWQLALGIPCALILVGIYAGNVVVRKRLVNAKGLHAPEPVELTTSNWLGVLFLNRIDWTVIRQEQHRKHRRRQSGQRHRRRHGRRTGPRKPRK